MLLAEVARALRQHRTKQAARRLRAGESWQDHDLVFCTRNGKPLATGNIRRAFRTITTAAGVGEDWAFICAGWILTTAVVAGPRPRSGDNEANLAQTPSDRLGRGYVGADLIEHILGGGRADVAGLIELTYGFGEGRLHFLRSRNRRAHSIVKHFAPSP